MTKEEAIKLMQAVKVYMISGNPIWSVEPIGEAFDVAIEALKQKWIPVTERLPKYGIEVVTINKDDEFEIGKAETHGKGDVDFGFTICVKYVHELQHGLKSCKVNSNIKL